MNRGAILSLLFAGLITGGYVELVTNQSDARPTEAEDAQAAQSADAVPGVSHFVAAYGESYLIDGLVVKLATDDGLDFELEVTIVVATTSSEMVAQNEVAIRDALIGVLEARTLKEYRDGSASGSIVPTLHEAIEEIVGRDIVRNVTMYRGVPRSPSRRSR